MLFQILSQPDGGKTGVAEPVDDLLSADDDIM